MDLARRPLSNPMAPNKYRDGFNAQSLGVDLNRKVKEVRKLHPTRSLTILPKQASPWGTCKVYQSGQLFAPELLPSLSRLYVMDPSEWRSCSTVAPHELHFQS
jgi:hypothetical protein